MNNKNLNSVAIYFAILTLVIFFSSTVFAGGSLSVKWRNEQKREKNQVQHT